MRLLFFGLCPTGSSRCSHFMVNLRSRSVRAWESTWDRVSSTRRLLEGFQLSHIYTVKSLIRREDRDCVRGSVTRTTPCVKRGGDASGASIFPRVNPTPEHQYGKMAPAEELTKMKKKKKQRRCASPPFSPIRTAVVVADPSWILKDDTVNKGRLQLEMRFFFPS